jgi:hypothetical protein
MGVELEVFVVFKNGEIFARLDTHKYLSACYDDLFELEKQEQIKKVYQWDLGGDDKSELTDDESYGDNLYAYNPADILAAIYKNRERMRDNTMDTHGNLYDDLKDPRVLALIGMLESFVKTEANSEYKIVLRWY